MRYYQQTDGEWVAPSRKGYKLACCDCGLVHILNFKLVRRGGGKTIIFQAFRDERATAQKRRHRKAAALTENANEAKALKQKRTLSPAEKARATKTSGRSKAPR